MMKAFNFQEDVVSTEVTVTDGFGDGGVGILNGTLLSTASLSNNQSQYYYNLQFNSKDHLSVTYGHINGSGSANQSTVQEGETKAVYGQFFNLKNFSTGKKFLKAVSSCLNFISSKTVGALLNNLFTIAINLFVVFKDLPDLSRPPCASLFKLSVKVIATTDGSKLATFCLLFKRIYNNKAIWIWYISNCVLS